MKTIASVVEEVLLESPFYVETMIEGVANNAEIARKIQPVVEERLYEKVSHAAVTMAVHRASKRLTKPHFGVRYVKRLSDITVRSNLVEFTCPESTELSHILETLSKTARTRKDTFINFARGMRESLIIVNAALADEVTAALKHVKGCQRIDHLSAISLRLPEESLAVPGVYHPIIKALALEGISFIEILSVRTELSILFADTDVERAFAVIKRVTS